MRIDDQEDVYTACARRLLVDVLATEARRHECWAQWLNEEALEVEQLPLGDPLLSRIGEDISRLLAIGALTDSWPETGWPGPNTGHIRDRALGRLKPEPAGEE